MIQFSVLIPQRDRGDDVRRQLPELAAALKPFGQPFEMIVVDDGSQPATLRLLDKLAKEFHSLRLLRLDEPSGASVALAAGIEAARGEVLIAIEPGAGYPAEQIPRLIQWLPRPPIWLSAAAVGLACPNCANALRDSALAIAGARSPRSRLPVLGRTARGVSECGVSCRDGPLLTSASGTTRIPGLRKYVEHQGPTRSLQDVRPNPGDLLAAWWSCRRWRNRQAYELAPGVD